MNIILKNREEINSDELYGINILEKDKFDEKILAILGNFDGLHKGHMELITSAINYAKENGYKTLLYTFRVLPPKSLNVITTLSEKLEFLNKIDGLDYVYIEEFMDVKDLSPDEFCIKILKEKLNASAIFCGFNYTFGKNKGGNVEYLKKNFSNDFYIEVINPVMYDLSEHKEKICDSVCPTYTTISSTYIKELLSEGKIKEVNELLGHSYFIRGKVVKGKQLARKLGYPTANVSSRNKKYPKFGVYGVRVNIEGYDKKYYGIMNIGKNPTIENEGLHIETHIFNFNDDIYGKYIRVELLEYIREERKMKSIEELKKQIETDVENWRDSINE